jgi:dynein heavy chain 1, cytosolic
MYGGRIDNRFDDMVLSSLVKRLFVTESFDFNFELCKDVKAPEGTTKSHFVKWVESLPTSNPPEWLGLPSSAEARLLEIQARHLISCYAKLRDEEEDEDEEKRDTENTDVTSWMRRACEFAKPWLNKLPNLSPLSRDSGSIDSPVFRCLNREVELGIALLETVREDLSSVCNAIQESAKISNRCRSVMRDLSKGMLPSLWRKSTFSSSHIVTPEPWISDLVRRVNQLVEFGKTTNWISNSIWLGGLASPEAFLTATRQEAAKSKQCSLQDLHLSLSLGSGEGFSFKGLILEGAGWDGSVLVLSDKTSTVLPSVRFTWTKTKPDVPSGTIALEVPSYLNASRDEVIFTVTFYAKADQPEHVWRQRGVAMICWSS